jgi:hypothetical protein
MLVPDETRRPWQEDIERVQQTMREVLRAIASLSGVELPEVTSDAQNPGGPVPQLDCKTLKDRIRNDLETFSISTASQMAKRAEEQARAALGVVQNEVSGRIEQVAGEFREKLQSRLEPDQLGIDVAKQNQERVTELIQAQTDEFARWVWLMCQGTGTPIPVRIEQLLAPYVEEATGKLLGNFQQRVEELFAQQEQVIQDKVQGTIGTIQNQIGTLDQSAHEAMERSKGELQGFLQGQMEEVRGQIQGLTSSAHESLSQEAARVSDTLRGLDQELAEIEKKHVSAHEEQLGAINQASMESLAARIRQTTDTQVEEVNKAVRESHERAVAQYQTQLQEAAEGQYNDVRQRIQNEAGEAGAKVAAEIKATSESMMQELSDKVNASATVLREEAIQASSRIEASLNSSLETYRQQLAQITDTGLEEHRKAITTTINDLHNRLRQAADLLVASNSNA